MQQEKRRRVFRAGLSVKDGEPVYLCRAITSRVFHGTSLSLGLDQQLQRCDENAHRQLRFPATSKMTSSSTGAPSGRLATPYTKRQGLLFVPKTSCNSSEAASATFG